MSQEPEHAPEGADPTQHEEGGPTGPVIRDKRRIDPETGAVREPKAEDAQAEQAADEPEGAAQPEGQEQAADTSYEDELLGDAPHPDSALAAQRLEDLRSLQAEFVNYKRRIERDRARDRELAVSGVVEGLLPVLDDIHSAREHGDLTEGPFSAIAEKLSTTLAKFGVEQVGAVGDTFDPAVHEALMHMGQSELPEGATETTIVQVMQPGFKIGDRVVRPARVAVADPA